MTSVQRLPWRAAPEAVARWRAARAEIAASAFAPRSTLTLSEWADRYRMLSPDLGEPGPWRTSRVPYLRRIMDAITDPRVRDVTVMKSARIGATQALVVNTIGYYIDQEPSPIIAALPTIDDATKFASQILQPMLDDTPQLAGRVDAITAKRARRRRSTMLQKSFTGGTLQIIGTKSARALRMVHGRIILMSEIDAYEQSAGKEGEPTKLLRKRAGTYGSPKFIRESTPLIKSTSRIEPAFEEGSQEYYHVPCPHCGEFQVLEWGGRDVPYGIKWEAGKPETAYYLCRHHGCVIEESAKHAMVDAGRWVANHPERIDHLSFHLNALVSPFDGARWPLLVKEWHDAQKKPEQIKVFMNTVLGRTWEEEAERVDLHVLERAERRDAEFPEDVEVAERVGILTRAVDVQDDRLEELVVGWGEGEELWPTEHTIIPGDPALPISHVASPWRELRERILKRQYRHATGAMLRPAVTFIDLRGHHTKAVYEFTKPLLAHRVYACHGSTLGEGVPLLRAPSRNNSAKAITYEVGVFGAKEAIMARLARIVEPGPGFFHIPAWMTHEHIRQLVSESLITRFVKGIPKRLWYKPDGVRNEFLDLIVYNMGGLESLGPSVKQRLGILAKQIATNAEQKRAGPTPESPLAAAARAPRPPRGGGGWVHNY